MQTIILLGLTALTYLVYTYISGLQGNIAAAKKSGLPYIVARKSISPVLYFVSNTCLHSFLPGLLTVDINV